MAKKKKQKQQKPRQRMENWTDTNHLIALQGWARGGDSMEQIAKKIGITRKTLYIWRNKSAQINNAISVGKEVADFVVENSLFKQARDGNVQAIMFWLKNREPDKWNNKLSSDKQRLLNAQIEEAEAKARIAQASVDEYTNAKEKSRKALDNLSDEELRALAHIEIEKNKTERDEE